ncbi:MAG TPA: GNAT family N-acetyltransferase [Solirubrobacteraceae bacterium]|nr:GNAT family N-acetyltransferase [Solirubrobacteraceae bacterium]
MSEPAPLGPDALASDEAAAVCWYVRVAREEDVAEIVDAVAQLLAELGAAPPEASDMHRATRALLGDEQAGLLLVAEADSAIVGVLAASWQAAIHIPGRYALIQDLWVHPAWRSKAVGGDLVRVLCALADERQVARVEVGLPRDGFPRLNATEAFYRANGFVSLGQRMRRALR